MSCRVIVLSLVLWCQAWHYTASFVGNGLDALHLGNEQFVAWIWYIGCWAMLTSVQSVWWMLAKVRA